jgi:hypothetical protein
MVCVPCGTSLSFDLETNLPELSGGDLAPIEKDCEFFGPQRAQLWRQGAVAGKPVITGDFVQIVGNWDGLFPKIVAIAARIWP